MPFVPEVGRIYTAEEMRALTPDEILHRPINDPQFSDEAVGSKHVDWQSGFVFMIKDPLTLKYAKEALHSMAQTPEGRATIRQALAMQKLRLAETGTGPRGAPDPDGRIILADGPQTQCLWFVGVITLRRDDLYGNEYYRGEDGKPHRHSMLSLLSHELCHAKDPLLYRQNQAALRAAEHMLNSDGKPFEEKVRENAAKFASDPFLEKRFGIPRRMLNYSDYVREDELPKPLPSFTVHSTNSKTPPQ